MRIVVEDLSKRFGATQALRSVSLEIAPGKVHSLVGENGAGKSTLGKIVAGVYSPDSGKLLVDGQEVSFQSPFDSLKKSISLIAQEISLVPKRTVVENVYLGIEDATFSWVNRRKLKERFAELCETSGIFVPGDKLVAELKISEQQKVEILRALARDTKCIIMDEPTARLSAEESSKLLDVIRGLTKQGRSVVYVSHFLNEVLEISDQITIMRDGQLVRTSTPDQETHTSLVEAMTGKSFGSSFPSKQISEIDEKPVLEVKNLYSRNRFADISMKVKAGEILVLTGLVGSGRSEVLRAIFGADKFDSGEVFLEGKKLNLTGPNEAIKAGIIMLSESRRDQGILALRSVRENISIPYLSHVSKLGLINRRKESDFSTKYTVETGVRAASNEVRISSLSGGNQQKALFARALAGNPKLLIADEPTRGVDVASKRAIYDLLASHSGKGMGILVVSSELEEVVGIAHRVLVMSAGKIVKELIGSEITESSVLAASFEGMDTLNGN